MVFTFLYWCCFWFYFRIRWCCRWHWWSGMRKGGFFCRLATSRAGIVQECRSRNSSWRFTRILVLHSCDQLQKHVIYDFWFCKKRGVFLLFKRSSTHNGYLPADSHRLVSGCFSEQRWMWNCLGKAKSWVFNLRVNFLKLSLELHSCIMLQSVVSYTSLNLLRWTYWG